MKWDRAESIPDDYEWCDDCGWHPPGTHVARFHEDDESRPTEGDDE